MMELKVLREKTLADCRPEQAFWMCTGTVCRNIYELADAIKNQNEWAFRDHVNKDHQKNDYSKWVADVLGDLELAARLKYIFDKDQFADIIKERIKELEGG